MCVACCWNSKALAQKAEDPPRHIEAAGGFSFVPPQSWQVREIPGLKYKVVHGQPAAGFAPNINVVDEAFKGTLDAYVKQNVATLQRVFKKARILAEQEEFKTTAGLQGVRLMVENEQNARLLRQSFYFFAKGDTKYVVTCTTLAAGEKNSIRSLKAV
jgi:hypothetical protein